MESTSQIISQPINNNFCKGEIYLKNFDKRTLDIFTKIFSFNDHSIYLTVEGDNATAVRISKAKILGEFGECKKLNITAQAFISLQNDQNDELEEMFSLDNMSDGQLLTFYKDLIGNEVDSLLRFKNDGTVILLGKNKKKMIKLSFDEFERNFQRFSNRHHHFVNLAIKLDLVKQILQSPAYYSEINASDAEKQLQNQPQGSYLFYYCKNKNNFVLAVKDGDKFNHLLLRDDESIINFKDSFKKEMEDFLIEIQNHPSYRKEISRDEATKILQDQPVGTWLIRYSPRQNDYALSMKKGNKVAHYLLKENFSLFRETLKSNKLAYIPTTI